MRNTVLAMAPVLLSVTLTAQGVFSNKTQSILEKVIQDYPNHFHNIKGELISQEQQTAEYRSTLQLPGSPSCTIILTGGKGTTSDEGYSWTCIVMDSESFVMARDRFQEIYRQLSNSIVTTSAQKTFILNGVYEAPDEEKKYTHVVFSLLPGVGDMKRVKVGLSLHQVGKKWRIMLSVNDRENPDEAQGAVTVN
ncbi:MAG TPA: hypothetical protein VHD83_02895 [Puia sp.]|nr:hypothetical protein [Puia sp.]